MAAPKVKHSVDPMLSAAKSTYASMHAELQYRKLNLAPDLQGLEDSSGWTAEQLRHLAYINERSLRFFRGEMENQGFKVDETTPYNPRGAFLDFPEWPTHLRNSIKFSIKYSERLECKAVLSWALMLQAEIEHLINLVNVMRNIKDRNGTLRRERSPSPDFDLPPRKRQRTMSI